MPNVNSRPALAKPSRSSISADGLKSDVRDRGTKNASVGVPNVHSMAPKADPSLTRPRALDARPKRGSDPEVIRQFKPGALKAPNVNNPRGWDKLRDPEVVAGVRNRDVKGDAVPRQRVYKDDYHGGKHGKVIAKSSCGHSFCGGHGRCVYGYDYHDPIVYAPSHGWCDDDNWAFSFSFGYSGGYWGVGVGVGYNSWYDDCNYYRPVYSCATPYWYNGWHSPVYYSTPYYCRPYYSLRYSYGCYTPSYWCYSSYYPYRATSSYWWLYDGGSSYSAGYDSGFASGFDAGAELAYDGYGGYQPTWLAGGSSASAPAGASRYETYPDPAIEPQADGWDLLAAGDAREARRAFDRESMNAPGDGLPQIGYAISSGLLERYEEAVAAMRKALREDPDAFAEVPQHPNIQQAIESLLMHYRNVTRDQPEIADAQMMSAALRHLLQEHALAYFAASLAIDAGDRDDSILILKELTQRALDRELIESAPQQAPSTEPAGPVGPPVVEPTPSDAPRNF